MLIPSRVTCQLLTWLVLTRQTKPQACNLTTYSLWQEEDYDGVLVDTASFWRYINSPVRLTRSLALDIALKKCTAQFKDLIVFQAGRYGPIDIQHAYDAMCSLTCLEIDKAVQAAMFLSHCSCLELSTQPGDFSYHVKGDICLMNTGRLLCSFGFCGIWNCRIDDFMCPRYEFNKKDIEARGPGACVSAASTTFQRGYLTITILLISCLLLIGR